MAVAAAVAVLARYTFDFGDPMRPTKLRLVVDRHFSSAPSTPINPPRHAPQVAVETTQPASAKISSKPSRIAVFQISVVAGTTIARVPSATLLPLKIC